jgi:tetratricopeptide (TPR) repeat protein
MATEARKKIQDLIDEDKLNDAERLAATNLDSFRSRGENAGVATMLLASAEVALAAKQASQALKAAREAWPLAKSLDKKLQAEVLVAMVNGLNMSGQNKEAVRAATSSLSMVAEAKEPALEAGIHHALAVAHLKNEDSDDALESAEKALNLYRGAQDKGGEAKALTTVAKAQRVLGRFDQAIATAKSAAALWRNMGQAAGIVAAVEIMSDAHAAQGYPQAALNAAEEELNLLKKSGGNMKNELIMMEKVAQVAADQGQKLQALRIMEDMIKHCKNAKDPVSEAQRTLRTAEMMMEMNHSQDALRLATEAEELFRAQAMSSQAEEAKKLRTQIFVSRDQHGKAPHRSEAVLALKSFVRAVEQRQEEQVKQFEAELDRVAAALKDAELSKALESLFERDPGALSFLEKQGLQGFDLDSFKAPTTVYQYPHNAFYLTSIASGMNFGPQFRSVHPYRVGKSSDANPKACCVAQLPETEAWQGQLLYRHGIMDAGIQATSQFNFPPL